MPEKLILGTVDYAIFGTMLAIYAATGLYFRFFGGKQKTNEEYLLAGKDMSIFPVSFSLMATYMSAITLVGIPADVYLYGTGLVFYIICFIFTPLITSAVFLPIYFKTGVSTAYEYLEKRFGITTRRLLSGIFLFQYILFDGVILYAPALAFSAVTNLSMTVSVISIGVVCTFYCTLGGMKAILWTDVIQSFLMYTCLIAIIIKGCVDLGLQNIFRTAYDGGRITVPTFKMDFSTRYTMWSVLLQGFIITVQSFGGNQIQVQRQLTLKNLKRSTIACLISGILVTVFHLLCCFCGLIFYVYFKSCDPMTSPSKPIKSADQLMPYYITSTMGKYPGLSGLCIAGIFGASLSSISSAVNSMAAVMCEDILRPIWPKLASSVLTTKVASACFGSLSIIMVYFIASMGNLVTAGTSIMGMVSGPALGVFLLAVFTTTANEMGTNLGIIAGFVLSACLTFAPARRYYPQLPVNKNCFETSEINLNYTIPSDATVVAMNSTHTWMVMTTEQTFLPETFPVSFMWISTFSLIVCLVVGFIGSWIITWFRGSYEEVPTELLSPVRQWFFQNKREKNGKNSEFYDDSDNVTVSKF